jgi:hypothetical protein
MKTTNQDSKIETLSLQADVSGLGFCETNNYIWKMKKLLFNEIERQIMHEDKSLYASRMRMHIATKRFEKEFMKTFVGRFIKNTVDWLASLLA